MINMLNGNIFRQAAELLKAKDAGSELTEEEEKLVALAMAFVANELARAKPECDEEPISEGLLKLAKLVEGFRVAGEGT